jgi:hypothetical protein
MQNPTLNNDYSHHCGVGYLDISLNQDIKRLRELWHKVQGDRDRDAIYDYLTAVYELVEWWTVERRAMDRARRALRTNGLIVSEEPEPFAAVIAASVAPARLDRRQVSKYARALQYAAARDCRAKRLKGFIKDRHGGLNRCAGKFSQRLRRQGQISAETLE